MISAKLISSVADEIVFKRGEFDPVQFLAAAGLLDDESHRDWLAGRGADLQSRLLCTVDEAVAALDQARSYLRTQG